jgi:hypothetical protein
MSSSMWYVQLRFASYQRGRWVTLACDLRPERARREAAALYRELRTDEGEYPVGVRVITGDRLARSERSLELALAS